MKFNLFWTLKDWTRLDRRCLADVIYGTMGMNPRVACGLNCKLTVLRTRLISQSI